MASKTRNQCLLFMAPIVVVFQFFGIAPRITPSKYKDIMHWILQYVRIVLMIVIFIYNPVIIWESYELTSRITLKILLLSYAATLLEAIATRDRQLKIIKQLCQIDEVISTKFCANFNNYGGMKKRYTWFVWGVFIAIVAMKMFHWILFNKAPFVVCITWAYAHFGISMRLIQNAFYVDMVYERLCILHQELNKLKYDCGKVQQQLNLTSYIYGKLWMMTNDINFSFGWSLLVIILECVVDLINEVNVMYSNCQTTECISLSISVFSFTVITAWPLVLLTQSCERCVMTAKKTSVIIHNISHFHPLKSHATDIRLLSLQISHETFYISANGFCNIDLGTIGSIIKTCTLYSIIIIQFNLNP